VILDAAVTLLSQKVLLPTCQIPLKPLPIYTETIQLLFVSIISFILKLLLCKWGNLSV